MPSVRRAQWAPFVRPFTALGSLRPTRLALTAGAAFCAAALLLAVLALWYERDDELRHAQRNLLNLSHTLAEQTSQTLETVDLGLKAGLGQLQDAASGSGDTNQNVRALRAHTEALAAVVAIGVYGAQGEHLVGSTRDGRVLPASLHESGVLAAHRSGKVTGLHVSAPMRSTADGRWFLIVSRRIEGPNRELRGIIAAKVDSQALAETYKAIDLGKNASVALFGWNGTLIASHPWQDNLIGRPYADLSVLADPSYDESSSARSRKSPLDGREVLAVDTPLRGFPLTLTLMADRATVLASWRRHAAVGGGGALLIGVLAIALALLLDRHIRRGDESVARMREHQAELTEAQRIARLGSFSVEGRTGAIHWSAQAAGLLGLPATRLPDFDALLEHVLEDDRARVRSAWSALHAQGQLDVEFRTSFAGGEVRWLRARAETHPGSKDAALMTRGTLVDVTDERRAEQAVQHLAAVVESSEDAILSFTGDGRVLSWNRSASRMFGYAADETIGRRLVDLLPPREAAEATRLIRKATQGESIEGYEIALTVKSGRRIHISVTLSPLSDAGGRISAASAVARDITARIVADRRSAMEHRIAQLLAESAPVDETVPRILETLCHSLAMDCGLQWELDPDQGQFRRVRCWQQSGASSVADPDALPGTLALAAGGGTLAEVWRAATPKWLTSEDLDACAARGYVSGLLIPITLGAKVTSLLQVMTTRTHPFFPELMSSAQAIGRQIGQYMERRRAEEDLRAEKEYIGHVIAAAPTLIACVAPDGTARSINPSIRDIAEFAPEDLVGQNFWLALDAGGDATRVEHLLEQARKGGVADYPLTIRTRLGELRDLAVSAAARRAPDGSIVEYVLIGADVTARRLDEARRATEYAVARALAEEQSEHEALVRILRTVCTILGWDCGVYRVNDPLTRDVSSACSWSQKAPATERFVQMLGTPRQLDPHSFFWRSLETRYPQWHNKLAAEVSEYLRPSLEAAGIVSVISVPVQAGERPLGALQFFGRSSQRPENVLIEAMQAIGRQVGQFLERKRFEIAQQQADERLRSIAANIPGIVFEYRLRPDRTAAFEYVSDRALDMLEEPPEAFMRDPRTMFKLVDPAYRRQLLRSMRASRTTRALWLSEMPIRTKSGRVRWVRGQSMPKYLEDGSVIWDGVIVDVTAQKQAEQAIQHMNEQLERRVVERTAQLSAANRELESFAYSVSHDLRAPLRSIDGFSRILHEEFGSQLDSTASDYLARVRNAAVRMGQLIDDLLSLSRVTRGELKRVRTDLSAMAESIVQELRAESPGRKVDVSIHPGMICLADPNLIRIALQNLIGNAWKFTSRRAQASIEVGMVLQRNKTVYYIRDDGAGFDMGNAGKLFGAFQRLHAAREFEGTGIGLATVMRIIDRHGGAIWAQAAIDRGATFYFTLSGSGGRA